MLNKKLLSELKIYVKKRSQVVKVQRLQIEDLLETTINSDIEDFINVNRKPPFSEVLFKLIETKGERDADIYKRAGIDRRHFSKIRTNPNYHVSKNTAIALAIALKLSMDEANEFLNAAGYSLSDNDTYDLVIQFCLEKEIYSIDDVNEALDYFSLKPLIGVP